MLSCSKCQAESNQCCKYWKGSDDRQNENHWIETRERLRFIEVDRRSNMINMRGSIIEANPRHILITFSVEERTTGPLTRYAILTKNATCGSAWLPEHGEGVKNSLYIRGQYVCPVKFHCDQTCDADQTKARRRARVAGSVITWPFHLCFIVPPPHRG
jgi:hypothetical protein